MTSKANQLINCQDDINPDHELLIWQKWIEIRKEETEHLANRTGRTQDQLAMNTLKSFRAQKERKIVLEDAKIEKKCGVRKSLWEQPARLRQKCYNDPVYELHRTRAELGRPRIIEHIGVPRHIQESEKGIVGPGRKQCVKLDAQYNSYMEQKEKELEVNIKKIDPFRPLIDELIIVGSKPKTPKRKIPPLPIINITSNYEDVKNALYSVYAIRINNTIFYKDNSDHTLTHLKTMQSEHWHINCDKWSYYFNCPVGNIGRSKLFLQNLGTVSLRYCWKQINSPHSEFYERPVFFFNKNENVICPGQKQELLFTFLSNKPGAYSEKWEIQFMNVHFFDTLDKQLVIVLNADSVENMIKIKRKVEALETIIYFKVLKNLMRDLLQELFMKATCIEPQSYPYEKLLLEAEMFIMKNPVYYYHQSEVLKLNDLFNEMVPDKVWDLSISSWRYAMINKDYDERMKYFTLLKSCHRECLKPYGETDDLLEQKYKAVNQLLGQMADKFDVMYVKIMEIHANNSQICNHHQSKYSLGSQDENVPLFVKNIFYIRAYEYVATTTEMCAGVLSSLDLNRWIEFDFCRT